MKNPAPLRKGDLIGVMAPSSRIAPEDLENAAALLSAKGYEIFLHPQCYISKEATQYAGTPAQKAEAFHDLVRNPDIKAVFFATGGTRSLNIIDLIDYRLVKKNPKIYMGFSDHTALLNAIAARADIVTYHGPTMKRVTTNPQIDFNLRLLAGEQKEIPLGGAIVARSGGAKGYLLGGNLTVFRALAEKDRLKAKGAILFFEDINEEYTTVERDLCVLRRAGIFKDAAAIIFGQFTNMKDTGTPFGMSMHDILAEHTKGLNTPLLIDAPFGHDIHLPVFPIGQRVTLKDTTLFL